VNGIISSLPIQSAISINQGIAHSNNKYLSIFENNRRSNASVFKNGRLKLEAWKAGGLNFNRPRCRTMKIFSPRTVPFKKSSLHLIRLNVICISFFAVSLLDSGAASIQGAISLKSGSNSLSDGKFFIQLRKLNPETGVFLFLKSAYVGPEKNYTYSFNDLEAGVYSLGCQDLSGVFAVQYYGGSSFQEKAKQVKLAGADKVSKVNFQLSEGRALGGSIA
jgi:hypothetical protein